MSRLFVVTILMVLCSLRVVSAQVTIKGTITPHPEWRNKVYLFYFPYYDGVFDGSSRYMIDSAQVGSDGSFKFGLSDFKKGIYRMSVPPLTASSAFLIPNGDHANAVNFVVSQSYENIHITGKSDSLLLTFQFQSPSPDNILVQKGIDIMKPAFHTLSSLIAKAQAFAKQGDTTAAHDVMAQNQNLLMQALMPAFDSIHAEVARSNHVLGALTILRYTFMGNYLSQAAYWDEQLARFEKLDPGNKYVSQIRIALDRERDILTVGSKAPEIALPGLAGDTVSLSSVKKRLIIIDFWASWCGPCVAESKQTIKPLYNKWSQKGLEVFAVSIDVNETAWKKAIEKHSYGLWLNVRDQDSDHGVKPLYDFTGYPPSMLWMKK